ncbi:MAG: phosphate ABC transporter substrate-binding protein [Deltaproteobacteria bacterium]|nr:phosphate ABC transporter substrate-binding protein [Deltaproteobacteria bacterium]
MKGLFWLKVLVLSTVFCFCIGNPAIAGRLVIKGSTTVLPIAQRAAEDFMKINPDVKISVSGGGSGNGIKAIIDGTTDIADASRFMKDKEIQLAMKKGVLPVPHRVALDCVVPVVHPSNPLKKVTMDQLKDIYTGKIRRWKELGGPNKPIVVISRDTSSGTYEVWHKKVLKKEKVTPKALLQASNGAVVQAVANNKYAIGYIGIGYLSKSVKALKVNNVEASATTALNGTYPISRPLFMFTNGWPKGDIISFINFLLSPTGQKIVQEEGYVPLYPVK